jgi:hypothetical protein
LRRGNTARGLGWENKGIRREQCSSIFDSQNFGSAKKFCFVWSENGHFSSQKKRPTTPALSSCQKKGWAGISVYLFIFVQLFFVYYKNSKFPFLFWIRSSLDSACGLITKPLQQ